MRKIALVAFSFLLFSSAGFAQARFGIKTGMNYYELDAKNNNEFNFYNGRPGFSLGMLCELPISKTISIQPEIGYSYRRAVANYDNRTLQVGAMEVPVLFKYNVPEANLAFVAGPQLSFLGSAKLKMADGSRTDWIGNLVRTDFGLTAGVERRPSLSGFMYGIRFTKGFSNIVKTEYDGGIRSRSVLVNASIGWLF